MSLLTNEQVNEIIDIHNTTHTQFAHRLREWNEKQIGIQFYVDWNNAPPSASRAELTIAWYNNNKFLVSENVLGFITRPTTPHPHAETMVKYAEVAQRRIHPWVEFEYKGCGQWERLCDHPLWTHNTEYRHIGETK